MTSQYENIDLKGPLEGIRYELQDHVAIITIDRPDRGNSLTKPMESIFRAIWSQVRDDPEIRVAIVTASGERHFSTGLDLGSIGEDGQVASNVPLEQGVFWSPHQNGVWKPGICAVNGLCVGGGLHFVVDADIVLATEDAAFMDAHVNVGMVGAVENVGLTRRLPLGAALRMTLMGRSYRMPARRNTSRFYDAKIKKPAVTPRGVLFQGKVSFNDSASTDEKQATNRQRTTWTALGLLSLTVVGLVLIWRRKQT